MAGTNDFLPIATGGGANVLTQSAYAALTSYLTSGYPNGAIVPAQQLNKAMRQTSLMAGIIGSLIADVTNQNVVDDGSTATILSNLMATIMRAGYTDDSGAADAYVVTLVPSPGAYYDGLRVGFSTTNTNATVSPTINVNGLGVVPITLPGGGALAAGQILPNTVVALAYNSTGPRFELQGSLSGRLRLTTNTTLYVATTGSDTTGTGAAGAPFATVQKAYSYAQNNYDLNGYTLTISVAAGTYTAPAVTPGSIVGQTQQSTVVLNGAGASTIFSTTSTSAISAYGAARITLQNMLVQTTTAGDTVNANGGATIAIGPGVTFGACAGNHLSATNSSTIFLTANYSISGGALNHLLVSGGQLLIQGSAIVANVTTPVSIGTFASAAELGLIKVPGWSVTGSAVTGTRYASTLNAVISGAGGSGTYFPGTIAGSTATGGQYA
jgi:hypothetical protein